MMSKIPEILIKFRTNAVAFTSDITKMYNILHLKDSALPYSLFLFGDSLDAEIPHDLYVMTTAWYGVSSTGNHANIVQQTVGIARRHIICSSGAAGRRSLHGLHRQWGFHQRGS